MSATATRYRLVASRPGHFQFKLDVVAKIQRDEPWNEISFTGPAATIASVTAQAAGTNTEVQLLNGTLLEAVRTNGVSRVTGFLGADQTVALRWQGKIAEVARKALLTVDSTIGAQITPTVIKYTSRFHYDVVQGNAAQLTLTLPAAQALTRLEGEQIRDWHTATAGDHQMLTIEFIKPVENAYDLTLYSEQAVGGSDASVAASLNPPQPLNVERESGSLTISAEDTLVEIDSLAGSAPGQRAGQRRGRLPIQRPALHAGAQAQTDRTGHQRDRPRQRAARGNAAGDFPWPHARTSKKPASTRSN